MLELLCGFQLTHREQGNLVTLEIFKYPFWACCEERLTCCEARGGERLLSVSLLVLTHGLGCAGSTCLGMVWIFFGVTY